MPNWSDTITDAEAVVMKVLWKHGASMREKEICDALCDHKGWGRQTVQTLIKRLVAKGALKKEKRNVFYYTPLAPEEEYLSDKANDFLQGVFDGSAKNLFATLLSAGTLPEKDLGELEQFWEERRKKNHG